MDWLSGIGSAIFGGIKAFQPTPSSYIPTINPQNYTLPSGYNMAIDATGRILNMPTGDAGTGNIPNFTIPTGTGQVQDLLSNPFSMKALTDAITGSNMGTTGATNIFNQGQGAQDTGALIQALSGGLSPYSGIFNALAGSTAGAGGNPGKLAQSTAGQSPFLQSLANWSTLLSNPMQANAAQTSGMASPLAAAGYGFMPYAQTLANLGMDPQNALYNRTLQQVTDQTRASQAARGIANTPYGAGLEDQALSNFNIDWQNNLLNRAVTGVGAGGNALTTGANLVGGAGNLLSSGTGQYGSAGGMFDTASKITQGIGGINTQAANIWGGLGGLNTQAGNLFGMGANITPAIASLLSSGASLGMQGASAQPGAGSTFAQLGGLPYSTFLGQGTNNLNLLSNLQQLGLGGQSLLAGTQGLQQTPIQDILNYLQLVNQSGAVTTGAYNAQNALAGTQFNQGQQQQKNFQSALGGFGGFMSNMPSFGGGMFSPGTNFGTAGGGATWSNPDLSATSGTLSYMPPPAMAAPSVGMFS